MLRSALVDVAETTLSLGEAGKLALPPEGRHNRAHDTSTVSILDVAAHPIRGNAITSIARFNHRRRPAWF
jgi:hypothetical protein